MNLGQRIRRYRGPIDAALDSGLSNALIESTNTKIRVLTRVAFGFADPQALIAWRCSHSAAGDSPYQAGDQGTACGGVRRAAKKGGDLTGPNLTDRGKRGTKYHLLVDRDGQSLNIVISGANRHDSMFIEELLDTMPAIKVGGRGHPRRRPVKLHADKAYDNRRVRTYLRRRGITARIACIGIESSQCLGRHRWVAERTIGWLLAYKRLALRYDRSEKTITALARLAVTLLAARHLAKD